MRDLRFEPLNREPCIMQRGDVLVIIYVNDYAIACLKGIGDIAKV